VSWPVDQTNRKQKEAGMALTESSMLPLGTPAPDFALPDTDGSIVRLAEFSNHPALLVVFMCNHCPFVKHLREGLAAFAREYTDKGLGMVGISSNDASAYPQDGPDEMAREKEEAGYVFPYLYDETQNIARAYAAACTPDFYLFDQRRRLVYRGQFDDSRPGNDRPVTGADLRAAVDAVLAGHPVADSQKPSIGCNIKWKR
jgi:peroxiredoxin